MQPGNAMSTDRRQRVRAIFDAALDLPADQRLEATLATTALGIRSGVDIVRVHDVEANVRVARMTDAIVRRDAGSPARPAAPPADE